MSLMQFLRILMARRRIVLTAFLSCLITAAIVSQLLPERYQATTRIMLDVLKPDPVTGESVSGRGIQAYARTQIELIKDYRTAGLVIDQLGWANDPNLIAEYNRSADSQLIDIRRWLAQRIIVSTDASLIQGSNILEITYTSSSADSAKRLVDLVREAYISESLRFRRESARSTADWYRDQTDKALKTLTGAEAARSKFARDNGIVLGPNDVDLESARLQALSQSSAAAAVAPPPMAMPAPVGGASMQLAQIDQQLAQAANTLGPNHPMFQALQRQRVVVAGAAAREASAASAMSRPQGVNAAQVERVFESAKSRVLGQREKIDQLNQMQNDVSLRRDQYLKAAQRAAELRLQADVGETGLQPLGEASASEKPSFPNIPMILAGAAGLGLVLGIATALLVEMLGRRVRGHDDLEFAATAPVFAVIGAQRDPEGWVSRMLKLIDRRRRTATADQLAGV